MYFTRVFIVSIPVLIHSSQVKVGWVSSAFMTVTGVNRNHVDEHFVCMSLRNVVSCDCQDGMDSFQMIPNTLYYDLDPGSLSKGLPHNFRSRLLPIISHFGCAPRFGDGTVSSCNDRAPE